MEKKVVLPGPNKKHLFIGLLALVLAIGFLSILWRGLNSNPNHVPSALLGEPAKAFEVSWLQGKEHLTPSRQEGFSLDDFKGRPLILNFWASWCYSCRAEATDFEAFWQRYKDRGLVVAGIAIQDSPEAAMQFAKSFGKTYILGMDSEDGKAAINYGVTGVPETFFINRSGVIIHKESGPVNAELLARYADQILQ